MQYFVIGADGQKYGPVDDATLKAWAAENRILPQTILEDASSGKAFPASDYAGLFPEPQVAPPAGPPQMSPPPSGQPNYANYPRNMGSSAQTLPMEYEKKFHWGAFLLAPFWGVMHKRYIGLLCLVCCGIVGLLIGVYLGSNGYKYAWSSGRFATVDECLACQKEWNKWAPVGLIIWLGLVGLNVMYVMAR